MERNVEPGDNRVSKKRVFGIVKEGSEGDGGWIQMLFLFEFGDKECISRSVGRVSDWKC